MMNLKEIPKEKIVEAIEKNLNIEQIVEVKIPKKTMQKYWAHIERILVDVGEFRKFLLSQRPDLEDILSTPKGIKWLNEKVPILYEKVYKAVWG